MKTSDLRKETSTELNVKLVNLLKEQFRLKMLQGTAQLSKTHTLGLMRKQIARLLCVLAEKREKN
jgi:large subunit ribosomal protein L29